MKRPLLWAALVGGAFLRLWDLGGPSLNVDEGVAFLIAAQAPERIPEFMRGIHEVHPPGYFWWLHFWMQLGSSELWLRLSSALAGWLTIPLLWKLSREYEDAPRADLAALVLALCTYPIQYSREVRMYPLLGLLATLALWSAVRWGRSSDRRWLAAYALSTAAGFWVHYLAFLVPLVALAAMGTRAHLRGWLLGTAVAGLLFLPWARALIDQAGGQDLGLRPPPGPAALLDVPGTMALGDLFYQGNPTLAWLYGLAGAGTLLAWALRPGTRLMLAWALGPVLGVWLVSSLTTLRIFELKYFVWCAPAAAYLFGRTRLVPALVLVNLATWGLLFVDPAGGGQDWRAAARTIREQAGPGTLVLVHPSMMAAPLLYYGLAPDRLQPVDDTLPPLGSAREIWLVTTPHHPLVAQAGLARRLEQEAQPVAVHEFARRLPSAVVRLVRYQRRGPY